jgi:hypothetical protein
LHNAIKEAKSGRDPIEVIVENQGFFKVIKLDYHEGEKYPRLTREGTRLAILDGVMKPMAVKGKAVQVE